MLPMPKRNLSDLVLDTIDIISARKNRPNLVRIYRHLHRLYDLSLATCESLLQSLLREGRVIRVTYKGNISYRNALKWKKYSYYMKKTMGSELSESLLTNALSQLIVQEPDYLSMGVPCNILEEHLLSMKDDNISKETIQNLLQRELKHESLIQLKNGHYFIGPKPPGAPIFDTEEVDLKFDKVKKVKTYKHEIKRLKDKSIETLAPTNFIFQNNNISDTNKELSNCEELMNSNITASLQNIENGGLEKLIKVSKTYNCNNKNYSPIMIDNLSKPTFINSQGNSKKFKDCGTDSMEYGLVIDEKKEIAVNDMKSDSGEIKLELLENPLKEEVEAESSSSQLMDLEVNSFDLNNIKCSSENQCSSSSIKEELNLESCDDSFTLGISKVNTTINSLEMTIPHDHSAVNDPFLTKEVLNKTCDSQGSSDVKECKAESFLTSAELKPERCPLKFDSKQDSPALKIDSKYDGSSPKVDSKQDSPALKIDSKYDGSSPKVDSKYLNSPSKVDSSSSSTEHKTYSSLNKVKRRNKKVHPTVERAQRKKRTKYDASDYYFPSLKRKSRDSCENDKKEDKRKKKKKKNNGGGCLSGIFAKRVMFPGNTSMCCECNCYISKVKLDPMIFCTTCANQGHQSCALKTMNGKNWYCVGCRSDAVLSKCITCDKLADKDEKGVLHCCSKCGDFYHGACHSPTTKKASLSDEWFCFKCSLVEDSSKKTNDLPVSNDLQTPDSDSPRPIDKPHENENDNKVKELLFLKEEPPDSKNWSSEDVYNYFKKHLTEEAAQAFLEQDIDGYALKLMGRSDVLNLGFKLGLSLKILFHIRRLQLRTNNLMDIWNTNA